MSPNDELMILVQALIDQLKIVQNGYNDLRAEVNRQVEQMRALSAQFVTVEKFGQMEREFEEIKRGLGEVKKSVESVRNDILEDQETKYKDTIRRQTAIMAAIGLAFLGAIVPFIVQMVFHH